MASFDTRASLVQKAHELRNSMNGVLHIYRLAHLKKNGLLGGIIQKRKTLPDGNLGARSSYKNFIEFFLNNMEKKLMKQFPFYMHKTQTPVVTGMDQEVGFAFQGNVVVDKLYTFDYRKNSLMFPMDKDLHTLLSSSQYGILPDAVNSYDHIIFKDKQPVFKPIDPSTKSLKENVGIYTNWLFNLLGSSGNSTVGTVGGVYSRNEVLILRYLKYLNYRAVKASVPLSIKVKSIKLTLLENGDPLKQISVEKLIEDMRASLNTDKSGNAILTMLYKYRHIWAVYVSVKNATPGLEDPELLAINKDKHAANVLDVMEQLFALKKLPLSKLTNPLNDVTFSFYDFGKDLANEAIYTTLPAHEQIYKTLNRIAEYEPTGTSIQPQ